MNIERKYEYKNRGLILAIVVLLPFMGTLDSTIINVALPVMVKIFNVNMTSVQLVVISYLVTIVSTILFFGRLGDIKGKSKIFNLGLLVFTIGSLLCGLSKSFSSLVVFRIIQALGASAAMANNQGIITQVFPASERGKALGINATFLALGTMLGPALGGFIISYLSWHYIFFINIPIGIIAVIMGFKILPKKLEDKKEKIDFLGAGIFGASVICLFCSLLVGQRVGYDNYLIILGFIVAICLFCVFIYIEKKLKHPLIDLSLFKNSLFSVGILCTFICYVAFNSNNMVQPFYLQDVLKMSPSYAGMVMMISPIIITVLAPFSGHLSDKIGSEFLTLVGLALMGAGLGLMATLNENSSLYSLVIFIALLAVGNALFLSPNNSLVMSSAPSNKLGIAGSINAFVRNLAQTSGVAMATLILYSFMSIKMGEKVYGYVEGRSDVFIYGMRYVYIVAATICLVGVLITGFRLKRRNKSY